MLSPCQTWPLAVVVRVGARVLAVVLAVAATVGVLSLGGAANLGVREQAEAPSGRSDPAKQDLATFTPETGVRALPLVMPDGAMAALPKDRPITAQEGQRVLARALAAVGLLPFGRQLGEAMEKDVQIFTDAPATPYPYANLDPVLAQILTDERIREVPPAVWVDLAAVLTVSAARPDDDKFAHKGSAMLAYALLKRVRHIHPVCDVQLQFAHIQSLGQRPDWPGTIREFRKAQELCGDDPTPLMALAVFQQSAQQPGPVDPSRYPGHAAGLAATRDVFDELDTRYPHLPLGSAGLAEMALQEAEYWDANRVRHFTARSNYREALRHVAVARARTASPELLIPQARAELGLGRPVEALELVDEFLREVPGAPIGLALRSIALREMADYETLAEHAGTYQAARIPNGLELSRDGNPVSLGNSFGVIVTQLSSYRAQVPDLTTNPVGGGGALDLGFLPEHRLTEPSPWIGTELQLYAGFLNDDEQGFTRAANATTIGNLNRITMDRPPDAYTRELMRGIGVDEWQRPVQDPQLDVRFERRQDLWRSAGKWDKAAAVTEQWTRLQPDNGFAWDRSGEIAYFEADYRMALRCFTRAWIAFRVESAREPDTWTVWQDPSSEGRPREEAARMPLIKAGAATEKVGSPDEAKWFYQLADAGESDVPSFYANSQLGLLILQKGARRGDFKAAAAHLGVAVTMAREWQGGLWELEALDDVVHLKGAQENNLALAFIRAGQAEEAIPVAQAALSRDEDNPIFRDTLAYAHAEAGNLPEARRLYTAALASDETNFVARNNLGVILGRSGDHEGARKEFEAAIRANPEYASGWHNLGIAAGRLPGGSILTAQVGFREAAWRDIALRAAEPRYRLDHDIYDTGFDVSRDLPSDWSFASRTSQPLGLSLLVIGIALGTAIRALFKDHVGGMVAGWFADGRRHKGWRRLLRRQFPAWTGLLMAMVAIAVSTWRQDRLSVEIVAVTGFAAVLLFSVMLLKWSAGRVYAWAPSFLASLLLPLIPWGGVTFAPMPCSHASRGWRRWGPAVLLGAVAAVLVVGAILVPMPVIRFSAVVAVTLLSCLLLPVRPHDGGFLPKKWWTVLFSVPLVAAALALDLSWI